MCSLAGLFRRRSARRRCGIGQAGQENERRENPRCDAGVLHDETTPSQPVALGQLRGHRLLFRGVDVFARELMHCPRENARGNRTEVVTA